MSREDTAVKRMAQLLKSGATMLERVCPQCNVPLFRLKSGEIICPSCGQRFVIVQSEEEEKLRRMTEGKMFYTTSYISPQRIVGVL